MTKSKKLLTLFITTFTISMTANSGYAILSVMKNIFVEKYKWFNEEEMSNYIALAQSAPGPIAVNASMIIGYQVAGLLGSLVAVFACILPPLIIMSIVTYCYQMIVNNEYVKVFMKGMQAGVVAMIIDVLISLFNNLDHKQKYFNYVIIILSFLYIRFTKLSVFYLVILCIIASLIKVFLIKKKVEAQ